MAVLGKLPPSKYTNRIFNSEETRYQHELGEHYAPAVCAITVNRIFKGTGFLIGGNLLMTASHVIDAETAKDDECLAVFYYVIYQTKDKSSTDLKNHVIKLDPTTYFYNLPAPDDNQPTDSLHLDFTIVALTPHPYLSEVQDRCFSLFKATGPTIRGLATICQCPPTMDPITLIKNDSKSSSGMVQKRENYSILYDSETEAGSSGGAVINSNGELIGLHIRSCGHKGLLPKYPWCNEGVLMIKIIDHLKSKKGLQEKIEKLIEDYKNEHPNNGKGSTDADPRNNLKDKHPDFIPRQNPISKQNYFDDLSGVFLKSVPLQRPVVVLWGDGGVGKSEIAIAFGNDYAENFSLVHLTECEIQTTYEDGYRILSEKLTVTLQGTEGPKEVRDKVHSHLEKTQFLKPWLLIFDNVKILLGLPLPQRGNGAIIITSRQKDSQDWFKNIEVTNFTEDESLDLFQEIVKKPKTETRTKLVRELAFIPLLINQAAHFIKGNDSEITEEGYLILLGNNDSTKITVFENMPINSRYTRSLLSSWKITFDILSSSDPEALNWLQFCSYLYPEAIPKFWLEKRLRHSYPNETQRTIKAIRIRRVLSSTYALMSYNKKSSSMSMHRYKQAAIQNILESEAAALKMQNEVLLFLETEAEEWLNLDDIIITLNPLEEFFAWGPNASWFLERFSQNLPNSDKSVIRIKEALANYRHFKGDYKTAEINYKEILSKNKELYGENSVEVALTLNNLGINDYKTGSFEEATTNLNQALEIRQNSSGDQSVPIADIKSTLGQILHRKGRDLYRKGEILQSDECYNIAKDNFQKALDVKKRKLGSDHRSVARALHCLGRIAYEKGKYLIAEDYLNQALAIRKDSYKKKDHTELAHNKTDLGLVLYKKKEYGKAEKIFLEVLEMRKELYGEGHPEIGVTLMDLGQIYNKQGQYQEAKSHLQRSCDILEKSGHRLLPIIKKKLRKVLDQLKEPKKS